VLHIATVHYGSPVWVEIQTRHLREHIATPYRTWTSLQGIDPSYASYFDRVIDQEGRHSDKLNHLAIEILAEASDDDLVMFLDGDAFPIADPMPLIADGLARAPLLAIRRPENAGDVQPHPSFCVTTAGFWREIGGDWSQGYRWVNDEGRRVSDVGGNLLRKLELSKIEWVSVLRSNRTDLDPIFFGIYGDVIYHHGAGFRGLTRLTRYHASLAPERRARSRVPVLGYLRRRADWRARQATDRELRERLSRLSEEVIASIQRDDPQWLAQFM
jgi:hypothetical protein